MKVMIIGSNEVYAMEHFFVKHLNAIQGTEATLLPINEWMKSRLNLFFKIERRLNQSVNTLYNGLNRFVLEEIDQYRPDVILVFKGMELYPDTLDQIRKKGILLTNFNPDHPFIISSRGSGNKNLLKSIQLYDLHFCYTKQVADRINSEFNIPAVFLPFGYESPASWEFSLPEKEVLSVCFIGTVDQIRLKVVKQLLEANIPVHVFGSNWHRYLNSNYHEKLQIGKPVYGIDFWKQAIQYRVQLNIFRPHNENSHNMRTFEMPAVGAIMLAPDSEEHRMFFEANQEAFYYTSKEEMIEKAKFLLSLPKETANQIRVQARTRSLQSGYSYQARAHIMHERIKELLI